MRSLLAAAALAAVAHAQSSSVWSCPLQNGFTFNVAPDLSYALTSGAGAAWLTAGSYAATANARNYANTDGSLVYAGNTTGEGTDAFGSFISLTLSWQSAPGLPQLLMSTAFRCYSASSSASNSSAIMFESTFPLGAAGTNNSYLPSYTLDYHIEFNASVTPGGPLFPRFSAVPGGADLVTGALGFIAWQGRFTNDMNAYGTGLNGYVGGQLAGPLCLFDANATAGVAAPPDAVVLGPASHFKNTILGLDPASQTLVGGPQGHITAVPGGYATQVLLQAGPAGGGITGAVYSYGATLRAAYGTSRITDPLVDSISYWTDNGAIYFAGYWNQFFNVSNGRVPELLIPALYASWAAAGVPTPATFQLDPWWYATDDAGACMNWTANPAYFPSGLPTLAAQGYGFVLYSSYFSASRNGMTGFNLTNSSALGVSWLTGTIAHPAPADSRAFYDELMRRGALWGMKSFEVDFSDFLYLPFSDVQTTVTGAELWWDGMASAAAAAGMPVQLCMDLPSDALNSVRYAAVTNARASEDDFPTNTNRWSIGLTALLYESVGLRPFYDDFWSTAQQNVDENPYGRDTMENFTEVSAAVSVLSRGPVGFSDALGLANATLLLMTARPDGRLLKPSLAATPIDATFLPARGLQGDVWQAPSFIPAADGSSSSSSTGVWMSVFAVDVPSAAPFTLYAADLHPAPPAGVMYVYVLLSPGVAALNVSCADGAPASSCLGGTFSATTPITIATGVMDAQHHRPHEIFSLAPVMSNGYALLGELGKFVRVSPVRFGWVTAGTSSGSSDSSGQPTLTFTVVGAAVETVDMAVLAPASGTSAPPTAGVIRRVTVAFGSSGGVRTVTCTGYAPAAACTVS